MRFPLLPSLGFALIFGATTVADDEPPPSKNSYVKVRVEVEIRGTLRHTDHGTTVTARERVFTLYNEAQELPFSGVGTPYTLDFARARDLRELAMVLSGKEVVVTGTSELRMVVQPPRPGGVTGAGSPGPLPVPTWSLQPSVQVTGLRTAKDN
jgi:hypothetical protein